MQLDFEERIRRKMTNLHLKRVLLNVHYLVQEKMHSIQNLFRFSLDFKVGHGSGKLTGEPSLQPQGHRVGWVSEAC